MICSVCRNHNPVLSSFMTYPRVYNKINTMGVKCGSRATYPSGVPECLVVFVLFPSFIFLCSVFRSSFVLTIGLSVTLRFMVSDYPFGIFKLFFLRTTRFWNNIYQIWLESQTKGPTQDSQNRLRLPMLDIYLFFLH